MGLFDRLHKKLTTMPGCKDPTDALRDNLYLLLNRDKIQKLSMMRLMITNGQPLDRSNSHSPFFREPDKIRIAS